MLEKIFDFSKLGGDYEEMLLAVKNGKKCSAFGMSQPERIISSLNITGKVLYLASDFVTAKRVYELYSQVVGDKVCLLPQGADVMTYKRAQSNENNVERIKSIFALSVGSAQVVVASVDSLFSYLPKKERFVENIFTLEVGNNVEQTELSKKLVAMGYSREAIVSEFGQFSVRGDIVDIYPINCKFPYRLEFFDVELQSIKIFDPHTQTSKEDCKKLQVCPFTNLFVDDDDVAEIKKKIAKLKKSEFIDKDAETRFGEIASEVVDRLERKDREFALDYVFPLIKDKLSTIFDYLPEDMVVVVDECKMAFDSANGFYGEQVGRRAMLDKTGEVLQTSEIGYVSKKEVFDGLKKFRNLAHQRITSANGFFKPDKVFSFRTAPIVRYTHNLNEFVKDMNSWLFNGYQVFVCAGDEKGAKQIQKLLSNGDIDLEIKKHASMVDHSSAILPYELTTGFILPARKIAVVGTYDILPRKQKANKILANRKDVFSIPKIGDFVVHAVHGIGVCEGVTKLTGNFGTKDYIVVKYRDNDRLYVPIDQLDQLDRFSGADVPKKLSKIGGVEFGAVKEKVKKNIKKMAFDLLELYAKRESKKGYAFALDDDLQREFENSFPHTETEDQLTAISEIKKDMQSTKVMDRLICGDVGFGKTEVALRAIFKAVLSGKQVAFLAPTTILSEQHYNTCVARFGDFGVNVGVLNRFKTEKEKKQILKELETGKMNVICGTHRLLSKDVVFDDLGLIVLDEEQKFGVEDKEKIKITKENVDVLTLSATPIPRTLHMSLTGIRDISVISTPPSDRLPVQTYVTGYSDNLVKDTIEKELSRDGQVYLVYNRVESIYAFASKIQKLVPQANIVVAHGQLPANQLEDVIYKFYNKMADVLICTTIIENGIDLSNANTLIVYDSDKFGLSQLYQIRGRVGRGNRMAYAYFTFNPDKSLSEDSLKRLEAIAEFTEFGSGFKIAMRDLEIRGSGNILGAEQHGHIQKVGYDLYCKMLNNAVAELKGKPKVQEKDVVMRVSIDAYIPENYIKDSENRMAVYKNISRIESYEMREKILEEIDDMYGKVPVVVKNLVDVAYIKSLAKNIGVTEVLSNLDGIKLTFEENASSLASEPLAKAIYKYSSFCVLNLGAVPTITFKTRAQKNSDNFDVLKDFLNIANQNVKK